MNWKLFTGAWIKTLAYLAMLGLLTGLLAWFGNGWEKSFEVSIGVTALYRTLGGAIQ